MITYEVRTPHAAATTASIGATTTALGTLISGATRSFILTEYEFQGQGSASAANEIGIYTVTTAGVTPTNALTFNTNEQPNAAGALSFSGTGFFTYATQPVANKLWRNVGLNSNGQRVFWRAENNYLNALVVPGGNNAAGSIAVFPLAGSGTMTGKMTIKEF